MGSNNNTAFQSPSFGSVVNYGNEKFSKSGKT